MKIGVCFSGFLYGEKERDFRHCYPNIKSTIIEPLKDKGFDVNLYYSTYKTIEEVISFLENEIKPKKVDYNKGDTNKSNKVNCIKMILEEELTHVLLIRPDIHFNQSILDLNIDYDKFNFLFPENYDKSPNFYCDNFYFWNHKFTEKVLDCFSTAHQHNHTHNIFVQIVETIGHDAVHVISENKYFSDINPLFSLCRNNLPRERYEMCNPEVKGKFK